MTSIVLHNLKSAWRNILKYRLQNALAVVCLAVGVICFSLCLYFVQAAYYATRFLHNKNIIEYYAVSEKGVRWPEFSDKMRQAVKVRGVKEFVFKTEMERMSYTVTDRKGNKGHINTQTSNVSSSYLNLQGYRSAVTGGRIDVQKPRSAVITDIALEQTYGKHCNPIGFRIKEHDGKTYIITDVANTRERMATENGIYIAADNDNIPYFESSGYLLLDDNADKEQVKRDISRIFKPHKVGFIDDLKPSGYPVIVIYIITAIGGFLLLIGIVGLMKMKLQLFFLRDREMALRKCMGATPRQMFLLIAGELLVIFFCVVVAAIAFTALLSCYAQTIITRVAEQVFFYLPSIFRIEMIVTGAAFTLLLSVSAAALWRFLRSPLSGNVGRSTKHHGAGHAVMLFIQLTITIVFMFIIFGFTSSIYTEFNYSDSPNADKIKNMMTIEYDVMNDNGFYSDLYSLPAVSAVARMEYIQDQCDSIDSGIVKHYMPHREDYDCVEREYYYYFRSVTPNFFRTLGLEIYERPDERENLIPVMMNKGKETLLGKPMKVLGSYVMGTGQECSVVGYAHRMFDKEDDINPSLPNFYFILKDDRFSPDYIDKWNGILDHDIPGIYKGMKLILDIKEGQYEEAESQIQELYSQSLPGLMNKVKVKNLHDEEYKWVDYMTMIRNIIVILLLTSIVNIMLSIYGSISLDTRRRRKEIAIRKVNGANRRQIAWIFYRYYMAILIAGSLVAGVVPAVIVFTSLKSNPSDLLISGIAYTTSVALTAAATLFTVRKKVMEAANINTAELLNND